jgi:predicted nucleic acid-binding protein
VSAVTVAETFYALRASYGVPRRQAAQTLAGTLNTPAFRLMDRNRILDALARVQSANVDFGNAYLAASAAETSTPVASFDRNLDKFPDVTRHEP